MPSLPHLLNEAFNMPMPQWETDEINPFQVISWTLLILAGLLLLTSLIALLMHYLAPAPSEKTLHSLNINGQYDMVQSVCERLDIKITATSNLNDLIKQLQKNEAFLCGSSKTNRGSVCFQFFKHDQNEDMVPQILSYVNYTP
jgi:hypothetical protein